MRRVLLRVAAGLMALLLLGTGALIEMNEGYRGGRDNYWTAYDLAVTGPMRALEYVSLALALLSMSLGTWAHRWLTPRRLALLGVGTLLIWGLSAQGLPWYFQELRHLDSGQGG